MPIVPSLKAAAVEGGLLAVDQPIDAAAAFALVRDMPYRRASSRAPEVTIAEWQGTCSGKHILLQALFKELGLSAMMILAPHEFTADNSPWLPPALLDEVSRAPVLDVHNFLRVQPGANADWITVDATWPLAFESSGLPVNHAFDRHRDMAIAADLIEIHHVPSDLDPVEMEERVLSDWSVADRERREEFLERLMDWLESVAAES